MAWWRRFATRVLAPAGLAIGIIAVPVPGKRLGPFTFRDDFSRYRAGSDASPTWFAHTVAWSVREGAYRCTDPSQSFAVIEGAPHGSRVSVEAVVRVTGTTTDTWKIAGVAIVADERNYWHLALVESPDPDNRKHVVELAERLDGVWLAQTNADTRLSVTHDFRASQSWAYDRPYRLRLSLGLGSVRGLVLDTSGVVIARLGFRLDNRAVTFGRPALTSGGFQVAFDDMSAQVEGEVMPPRTTFPAYHDPQRRPRPADAAGFFRVTERGGRSWFLDPHGREFFALGTDHVNWRVHWCEQLGYAPYHRNLVEKYDGDEARWARGTRWRLRRWGFNMLGVNSSPSVRHGGLPHVDLPGMGQRFAAIENIVPQVHWTGFPDVFSDRWPAHCDKMARRVCAPQKDDPWLVGYFIDNELEWYGKTGREDGMADEAFKKPADHAAKKVLIRLLRERYPTIEDFNAAWSTALAGFDALAAVTEPVKSQTDAARRDKRDFVRMAAERYFREATAAMRRHDPNHLILGSRFAGRAPDIWDIAGKHCDVISVNAYRQVDLASGEVIGFENDLRGWREQSRRPIMITEWSFPALDSGLPCKHGAGQRFDTQAQRAQAFEIFQTLLLRTPFVVGSDFFMWVDEPALGISSTFPEDSNYGLVNERDVPYAELTAAATRVHAQWRSLHREGPVPAVEAEEPEPPSYAAGAPWARDTAERLPLLVWGDGPTEQPLPVAAKLRDLWPAGDASDIAARALALTDQSGDGAVTVPFQIDALPDGPEIVFRIAPQPARTLFLHLAGEPVVREGDSPILTRSGDDLRITTGPLLLVKDRRSAAIFDRIDLEGTEVGSLSALLWQQDEKGDHWQGDNTVEILGQYGGPLGGVMDFVTVHSGDDLAYRAAYRVTTWHGEPWFSSRCLWIENTAAKPWTLVSYYHYARSALGGEAADDVVGGPGVPNYYLPFAAWTDSDLGISYGVLSPRLGDFHANFWKDERGGQHADFMRRVGVVLQPGQRFDEPQPEAIVFAGRGPARDTATAISRQVHAARAVRLKGLAAERR